MSCRGTLSESMHPWFQMFYLYNEQVGSELPLEAEIGPISISPPAPDPQALPTPSQSAQRPGASPHCRCLGRGGGNSHRGLRLCGFLHGSAVTGSVGKEDVAQRGCQLPLPW